MIPAATVSPGYRARHLATHFGRREPRRAESDLAAALAVCETPAARRRPLERPRHARAAAPSQDDSLTRIRSHAQRVIRITRAAAIANAIDTRGSQQCVHAAGDRRAARDSVSNTPRALARKTHRAILLSVDSGIKNTLDRS